MEDAAPFPYDLADDELLNEVKYSLGIEAYPREWLGFGVMESTEVECY